MMIFARIASCASIKTRCGCLIARSRETSRRLQARPRSRNISEACAAHFAEVRRLLDAEGIAYVIDPLLVRGLDYYSRTAFEVMPVAGAARRQSVVGAGGRYDGLAELLGGRSTP